MQDQEIGRMLARKVRKIVAISPDADYQEEVEEAFRILMWACGFSNEEIEGFLAPLEREGDQG